jgi:capsular polysaccharide biosynthesis protein
MQSEGVMMKPRLDIKDLIVSILESRKMAERVIEQLGLKNKWGMESLDKTIRVLRGSTIISSAPNAIIKLSVRAGSPELAASIANTYVDNLDHFNRQLDIGLQRQIVQVIDRATIPEARMPRGTIKNIFIACAASFIFSLFLAFFLEFLQKSDIRQRLKEIDK